MNSLLVEGDSPIYAKRKVIANFCINNLSEPAMAPMTLEDNLC